MPRCWRICGL